LSGFTFSGPPPPPTPHAPRIDYFTPDSAATGATVTIRGRYFVNISNISFGGTPAASFTVASDSVITAIIGSGATGAVIVKGDNGVDTLSGFRYITTTPPPVTPPPSTTITSFSPASASAGETVNIRGIHFIGATAISFGGTPAASFNVTSDSTAEAVLGLGSSGAVTIITPDDTASLAGFTYLNTTTPPADSTDSFTLVQFTGSPSGSQVALQWQARNEKKITYYVIQRGNDSTSMNAINSIQARGKNSTLQTYAFIDPSPGPATNYYRLKIEDSAGNAVFSNIIAVQMGGISSGLTLHPNPASSSITVAVPNLLHPSQFQLIDMSGKILVRVAVAPGTPSVEINVTSYMKGVYKLEWSDGVSSTYQLVMILR
jgi:hypothetical protein